MNLLVDIGNSRIKWCNEENGMIKLVRAIELNQILFLDDIEQQWVLLKLPNQLAISSVGSKLIVQHIIDLANKLWPDVKILIAKSLATGFSVTNAYPQANKLGVDRWLGLIALRKFYPGNSCVVDCGTAITIDCLNSKGQHLGGLISPGLQLMKRTLNQQTEDLSYTHKQYSVGLSNLTEAAIYSGTLYAAAGLIEKSINNLCSCQTIVLTGGDADLLANFLEIEVNIEPDFIFMGLSLFCKGEKQS